MHTREPPPLIHVAVLYRHLEHPLERKIMEAREIKRHHPEIKSVTKALSAESSLDKNKDTNNGELSVTDQDRA
ncbi:hypothetical protein Y032_0024g1033 [Ancylostoma ceylanicum]|nr:hypothetical protein Y032_0024g1033 [Ancylostoma ceylanicum]